MTQRLRERARRAKLKNQLLQEQIRHRGLERTAKLLENSLSSEWLYAYADMLDRFSTRDAVGGFQIATTNDRRWGRNFPMFQTEQDLALLRMPSRILCATNSYAIGLLEGLTSYVIGDGITYQVVAKKGQTPPKELLDTCQEILDEFGTRNQWYGGEQPGLEEEAFWRSCEDGEFCHYHHCDDHGLTWVYPIEPEQITQPPAGDPREWYFGIRTEPNNTQQALAYWIRGMDTPYEGQEYDASEVVHFRRNTKRVQKRGMPDFSWDVHDTLQTASKLRRALATGAAIQASIAAIRQHEISTAGDAQDFTAALADYQKPNLATGRTDNVVKYQPGQILDIGRAYKYVDPPGATNAQAHVVVLGACLRGASVRWNAPEWLGSADASNNNFASSLTAESPFVQTVTRKRRGYKEAFTRSHWIALENRVRWRGGIRVMARDGDQVRELWFSWADVRRMVEIQAEAPTIEVRNKLEEAQVLTLETKAGVTSPQTWQKLVGRDPAQEIANLRQWKEEGMPMPNAQPAAAARVGDDDPAADLIKRQTEGREWVEVPDNLL
jgi:hypothetical protein